LRGGVAVAVSGLLVLIGSSILRREGLPGSFVHPRTPCDARHRCVR
jgi:hypothetical protein